MASSKCLSSYLFIFGICLLGIFLPLFLVSLIDYLKMNDYEPTICNITQVEYPIQLPYSENMDLWSNCDCGRRCTSRYPCIKIYSNLSSDILKRSLDNRDESCTFTESSCPHGEDPAVTFQSLEHSIRLAESYINSSVTCYVNKNDPSNHEIFLEYDDYLVELIIFTIIFSLFVIIITIMVLCLYYKDKKICVTENNKDEFKSDSKSNNKVINNKSMV